MPLLAMIGVAALAGSEPPVHTHSPQTQRRDSGSSPNSEWTPTPRTTARSTLRPAFPWLDTYVRTNDGWRLLSMGITEPPSWPEVAKIDPQSYSDYAGTYRLSPTNAIRVTNEGSHLMREVTGRAKVKLCHEKATTAFDRSDSSLARTIFERDATGKVVTPVYRALGQTLRAVWVP